MLQIFFIVGLGQWSAASANELDKVSFGRPATKLVSELPAVAGLRQTNTSAHENKNNGALELWELAACMFVHELER